MKIWYIATIKEGMELSYLNKYAGRKIYVYKMYRGQHDYYGRLFNNNGGYWFPHYTFSKVKKLS